MRAGVIIWFGLVAGACGGEAASTAPLDEAALGDACDAFCEYEVGCGLWADEPSCQDYCHAVGGLIRGDAADMLIDCYLTLECDAAAEASCIADTIDAISPSAAYDAAHAACVEAEGRCDDGLACEVTYFVLLSDETLDALTACFDGPCDDVTTCIEDVLGPVI